MKKIFLSKPPEQEAEKAKGLRFIPRAKSAAPPAAAPQSNKAPSFSSRRQQTPAMRYSASESGANPAKVVLFLLAALVLIVLVTVICAANKPKGLSTVPAPRVASQAGSSAPPERMWIKEQMDKQGQSEELKARKARISQFQNTGTATAGQR